MNNAQILKKIPYRRQLQSLAIEKKAGVWLVGGLLRDLYLKLDKELVDFDFCVARDASGFAREFARRIQAKFICLDETQGSYRVILKNATRPVTYDFTLMRGKDLPEDLRLRDFSINTLALSVVDTSPGLIDLYGAQQDLRRKRIRVIEEKVLRQDPLRILRGFSFMANYAFVIEPATLRLFKKYKHLLKRVSRERVSEELFKLFSAHACYPAVVVMDRLRVIDELIPQITKARGVHQGGYHHLDVWKHSLEALRQFELLLKNASRNQDISRYLAEEVAAGHSRAQMIKFACLLHDIGKPKAKKKKNKKTIFYSHEKIGRDISERIALHLRFSFKEKELLKRLIFWHLRPGYLAETGKPTARAVYRFFRDTETEGVATILLALADWRATCGPLANLLQRTRHERALFKLMRDYFLEKRRKPVRKLLDGFDIMKKLNIVPSPLVGEILKKISEEQALGRVTSKSQAFLLAKRIYALSRKNRSQPELSK